MENKEACNVILCYSVEEASRLHSIATVNGVKGEIFNNFFICNDEELVYVKEVYPVEHVMQFRDMCKWIDEGSDIWGNK